MIDLAAYLRGLEALKARLEELGTENQRLGAELDRTQRNRDAIIREKRELQEAGRMQRPTSDEKFPVRALPSQAHQTPHVTISREQAKNPARYREAKAEAERVGARLVIMDPRARSTVRPEASTVKFIEDGDSGTLYANKKMLERLGLRRLHQIAANKGATLQVFRSANDLPGPLARKHAQILAAGNPDTLLDDE